MLRAHGSCHFAYVQLYIHPFLSPQEGIYIVDAEPLVLLLSVQMF